ncbi:Peptidoglycan/xylan/chitin deacetylase, PgdA/CDA1 family [Halanaeroarchaeum sp. HSR-CO]|uniref:polysaccharide deacetylase family protein n=1 Tax=Halanaeroarchaeum sp. HSR-CO TaxID=2866382 RepID=UPI00217F22CF|nr:polysaccharide deacetylase family protein [Halanaeroarchaeum sp. HSR-CO]UWG47980.1 Peptidoglycan/xylan/chitin deacetylase, PgdA/CDA1 family [Halanaeroarchaeum sp. HSR-CO]
MSTLDDHPFALALTHDVDRVRKTYQALYYAMTRRDPGSLLDLLPGRSPYWQFQTVMDIESDLGVRSAFYFLDERSLFGERPPREWLDPTSWRLYAGRYDLAEREITDTVVELDEGGWEIGLHGSYDSYRNPDQLRREKRRLERILGHPVMGGRQHYLNLKRPDTWKYQAAAGLRYDSSLGSSSEYGFDGRYEPFRPFDDEFVVFPLTVMEKTLPAVESDPERAWAVCEDLLQEARENAAVMTVLWHPSYFYDRDHPNYGTIYRRLIERALEMGAWVGPPGEIYRSLDHPTTRAGWTESESLIDDARGGV